jgi:tRNA A-37 threonylcarbamoyl transferase component Bud32
MSDIFTKKYSTFTPEIIEAVANKYDYLEQNLTEKISIPKVVNYDNSTVTFKRLPIESMISLRTIMSSESKAEVAKSFFKAGKAVAKIHHVLKPVGYVHGDLWPGNIFFHSGKIAIIDFEPTSNSSGWKKSIHNRVEYDLAQFIMMGETLKPEKNWWRYPRNRSIWYKSFLKGYKNAGGTYDEEYVLNRVQNLYVDQWRSLLTAKNRSVSNRISTFIFRSVSYWSNPMLRAVAMDKEQ